MKQLQLTDRVVVEVHAEECTLEQMAAALRAVAEMIEQCRKGGEFPIGNKGNLLWEHESKDNGGFRIGNRSLIRDAYYGAKEFFEVCSVSKDDIEQAGFDSRKLSEEDMQRIASKQGDLITDCCDYWTALEGACEYWEVPRKDDDSIRAHLDDILVDDETDTGGTSFHNQTLRELLEEIPTTLNEMDITLDDDVSVLDDILKECGIKPIVKDNNDIHEVIPGTEGMLNELSIRE